MNYEEYVTLFNTGDDTALVEHYYADDVVFSGGNRDYRGKDELINFLNWAHDGVREVIRVQNKLQRDDLIFVEVDMDFHASKERADFPFGHLYPGDLVTVKFFVTYKLRDDRIVELKSMTWPPEKGVTKLPRLGGHPSQIAAFHAYTSAFSNAHGRQGIIDFYKPMFEQVREKLTVNSVTATDEAIKLDAITRFSAIRDAPDFVVGALKQGEYIEGRVLVDYRLRNGLISHIQVTRGSKMVKHTPT